MLCFVVNLIVNSSLKNVVLYIISSLGCDQDIRDRSHTAHLSNYHSPLVYYTFAVVKFVQDEALGVILC